LSSLATREDTVIASSATIINAVDEHDNVIGTIDRSEVFRKHVNFRVVHAFVFNSSGALLLQQLASQRDRHPLQWGSSVAGYVHAGETYDQAIRRKVGAELGLPSLPVQRFGKTAMRDQGCLKFITLYTASHDGPVTPDPAQIAQVTYLPLPAIIEARDRDTMRFTPTFLHLLDFYLTQGPSGRGRTP
jgi:isopentenyldiphosphate isomerase